QRLALAQRLRRLRHHAAQRPRVGAHVRAVRVNLGVEGAHGVHDVRQAPRAQAGPALAGREDGGRAPAEDEAAGEEALERHHALGHGARGRGHRVQQVARVGGQVLQAAPEGARHQVPEEGAGGQRGR
ncbi:hypothetical protein EG859_15390, partial [Enterococcus faecalis]